MRGHTGSGPGDAHRHAEPEIVVIGSIFARQRDLLWPPAEKVIREEALPLMAGACRVLPAALGESIGDYAGLSVADGACDFCGHQVISSIKA